MENNNLQNIFDAIVGWNGSAPVEGWRHMTYDDLAQQAFAQAENYYAPISDDEADRIVATIIFYKDVENSNDAWHVRAWGVGE